MSALGLSVLGLAVLVIGSELVVRAGTRLAALIGVPPILIGLTIVAVGTSAPELAVGIGAATRGAGSLAVGNIAGTNTFNILFILGVSAAFMPLALEMRTLRLDLPTMTAAAVLLIAMASDGFLTRTEGAILVAVGSAYTLVVIRSALGERRAVKAEYAEEYDIVSKRHSAGKIGLSFGIVATGIAVIVTGAGWLVDGAVELARMMGVSEAFIGLTIVGIGTSAPELVTTVVSTLRQQRDIAVGNLLGSSVYNIVIILGVTAMVPSSGIAVEPELVRIDLPVMTVAAVACVPIFLSGRSVSRMEDIALLTAYIVYLGYLVIARG